MNSTICGDLISIKRWSDKANRELVTITSRITEIENLLEFTTIPENDVSLIELLTLIDHIQNQHQSIVKDAKETRLLTFQNMETNLRTQMKLLEQTFNLLNLEAEK